ncbi:MAG: RNA-binding protein [Planctomycetes bacterium]|nr:RNA-binding protein [Planctomycetota bacterium]
MLNIYVGNLPLDVNKSQLHDLFSQYGEVERVNLITDRDTDRARGFCFVEMHDDNAGRAAIEALNGHELGGQPIIVSEARPRKSGSGGQRPRG